MSRWTVSAAALVGLVLASGCGSAKNRPGPSSTTRTSLSITVRAPTGVAHAEIGCANGSATISRSGADAEAACEYIREHPSSLRPAEPDGIGCAARYYGPETIDINGHVAAREISMHVTRSNACQESSFQQLRPLLAAMSLAP